MLLDFPGEIIERILDEVLSRRDLKNLCEVSISLYRIVTPRLYKTVVIEQPSAKSPLMIEPLLRTCHRSTHCLQFVKNIEFKLRWLNYSYQQRCTHTREILAGVEDENNDIEPFLPLGIPVSLLLDQLKDHHLKSFSWKLYTCIPSGIFGANGYLAKKQKRLQSLSLVTGISCDRDIVAKDSLDLSKFKHLRTFRWTNIRIDNGTLRAFRTWFKSQIEHLENLELQFTEEYAVAYDYSSQNINDAFDPDSNSFCDKSLGLYLGDRYSKFPSLKTLCLTEVCITPLYTEIACFFNFSRLHTLRLRGCPFASELLAAVAQSRMPINLTTFEYSTARGYNVGMNNGLEPFLKSFKGLQYLYLEIHEEPYAPSVVPIHSIAEHKSTLKHLAYCFMCLTLGYICQYGDCDSPKFPPQICDFVKPSVTEILERGKLECFSFSDSLAVLKPMLEGHVPKTLKVLHIRASSLWSYSMGRELQDEYEFFAGYDCIDHLSVPNLAARRTFEKGINNNIDDVSPLCSGQLYQHLSVWENYRIMLREFACWAFNGGFPGLQYLVYGDFPDGRLGFPDNIVFCKNRRALYGFRVLKASDEKMQHLWDTYSDFLTANPQTLYDDL